MAIKITITKRLSLSIALLTLTAINASAQRNFKPGYVVSIKGDTTKGWIDYRDWSLNPKQIAFKTQESANIDLHSAKTLTAFGVSQSESYKRYTGPVSIASVNITKLINNKDQRVKQDTVFLRLITAGKHLSLFEYTDEVKQRFFIAEETAAPVELNYYRYFNQKNDGIITDNAYRQQLQRFVANYEPGNQKLITQIQKAEYISADMEEAVMAINGVESSKTESRSELVFFGGLAANATHTTVRGATKSGTSILPQLNAGLNFVLNKNVRAFIVRAELNVTGSKADVTQNANVMDPSLRTVFDKVIISLAPQAIYNIYNTEKVKAFLAVGVAVNYYTIYNQKNYLGNIEVNYDSVSNSDFSTVFKAGVSLKKFEVYVGYNKRVEEYAPVAMKSNSYQLGLNYFFN